MNVKKDNLKRIIKQLIRENLSKREYQSLLTEVSPPGKKAERMIHHVKKSLRAAHPDWSEERITGVAIATGWKAHNKGSVEEASYSIVSPNQMDTCKEDKARTIQTDPEVNENVDEAGLTSEGDKKWIQKAVNKNHAGFCTPMTKKTCTPRRKALAKRFKSGLEEYGLTLQPVIKEVELTDDTLGEYEPVLNSTLKDPDNIVPIKLKDLISTTKQGSINPASNMNRASYKVVSPNLLDTSMENKARSIQIDPLVGENKEVNKIGTPKVNETSYKVQGKSCKTCENGTQLPKSQNDPRNA